VIIEKGKYEKDNPEKGKIFITRRGEIFIAKNVKRKCMRPRRGDISIATNDKKDENK
jgi:hypothetical protein